MNPLTVSEVAFRIRDLVRGQDAFHNVSVIGEITDFRGMKRHLYFSLKDDTAVLRCVMWNSRLDVIKDLKLDNGMKVILTGDISTYPGGSNYQLDVKEIKAMGTGDLYKKFIELKTKLQAEGLFEPEHKKPIPKFIRSVGLISSIKGAGLQDMISVFEDGPPIDVLLYDSRVQGEGASEGIIQGLRALDDMVDIIIFGRGGGSMEDLWCFNDEKLARAVFGCSTPTISAVGHDVDQVITDLVADAFAVTPTAAAKLVVNNMSEVIQEKSMAAERLTGAMEYVLRNNRQTLDLCDMDVIGRAMKMRIDGQRDSIVRIQEKIDHSVVKKMMVDRSILVENDSMLRSSWVAGIKEKGLVAFSQDGNMIRDVSDLEKGEFKAMFRDGKAKGEVKEIEVRKGS